MSLICRHRRAQETVDIAGRDAQFQAIKCPIRAEILGERVGFNVWARCCIQGAPAASVQRQRPSHPPGRCAGTPSRPVRVLRLRLHNLTSVQFPREERPSGGNRRPALFRRM